MKIKLSALVASLTGALVMLGAGSATAHRQAFNSQIQVLEQGDLPPDYAFFGRVTSDRAPCKVERHLKLIYTYPGGVIRVVDEGTTSRRGYFILGADPTAANTARIVAVKKRFGPKTASHRHVCKRVGILAAS